MTRAFVTPCSTCGADARRSIHPGVAVGFAVMGVYLIWIARSVAWYGGVGVMHEVLGWTLVVLALWGGASDTRALLRGRETSHFWLDTRARCARCGGHTAYARDVRLTRILLLATLALVGYLQFIAPRL